MSKLITNSFVLGQSGTDTNNFLVDTDAAGSLRIRRKSDGTGGTLLTIDSSNNINAVSGLQLGGVATGRMVLGTSVNTTSGTAHDFTGIPSWARRVTLMLDNVSLSGTAFPLIQIGSGSVQTAGYASAIGVTISTGVGTGTTSSGLAFSMGSGSGATYLWTGHVHITLIGANKYIMSGILGTYLGSGQVAYSAGSVTLSGSLDRVRLTSTGSDTFDAGSVNILYEG